MKKSIQFGCVLMIILGCSDTENTIPNDYEVYSNEAFKSYENISIYAETAALMADESVLVTGTGRNDGNVIINPFLLKLRTDLEIDDLNFLSVDERNIYRKIALLSSNGNRFVYASQVYDESTSDTNIDIRKIDANGEISWVKNLGTPLVDEKAVSLVELENGDYIILAEQHQGFPPFDNYLLMRVTNDGDLIWSKTIHDDNILSLREILYNPSNNAIYILSENGIPWSNDGRLKIAKFDIDANIVQSNIILENAYFLISDSNMKMMNDGNILVYASSRENKSDSDFKSRLYKFNTELEEVWSSLYNDFSVCFFSDVIEKDNGNLLILSKEGVIHNDEFDVILAEMDNSGTVLWGKIYGSYASDQGGKILQKNNGDLLIVGNTNFQEKTEASFNMFTLETDSNGYPK